MLFYSIFKLLIMPCLTVFSYVMFYSMFHELIILCPVLQYGLVVNYVWFTVCSIC